MDSLFRFVFEYFFQQKAKNERILIMFGITISCNLKLPVCKNYINFADTVGIYKYQRFGANILEIGPFLLKLSQKYEVFMGQKIALKMPKTCLVRDVTKMT